MSTKTQRFRFTFECWKCKRPYTLVREIEGHPVLSVQCPYCFSKGTVNLDPHRERIVQLFRSGEPHTGPEMTAWAFPETLATADPGE